MTRLEAAALVAILVNSYPSVRFTEENAAGYESHMLDLQPREAQLAIEELINSSQFLPPVAAIRAEYFRMVRERARQQHERETDPRRLLGTTSAPTAQQWGACLSKMLDDAARHRAMSAAWCKRLGVTAPPDPGAEYIEIAQKGSRGDDVSRRVQKDVLGWSP